MNLESLKRQVGPSSLQTWVIEEHKKKTSGETRLYRGNIILKGSGVVWCRQSGARGVSDVRVREEGDER